MKKKQRVNLLKSFQVAFEGIFQAFSSERNMKIHGAFAVVVIALAAYFRIRYQDWLILLLLIAIVISLELVNTAIERAVDLISPNDHPLAKAAKDMAAGAVLTMVIASIIIGGCIFIKYL
ncbi:MAG: diacylglycerol kinase family protein [Tuberibacillus sp.]